MNKDFVNAIRKKYNETTDSVITNVIDKFQSDFECCGYNDYTDWKESDYYKYNGLIPKSCCKDQSNPACPKNGLPELFHKKVTKIN